MTVPGPVVNRLNGAPGSEYFSAATRSRGRRIIVSVRREGVRVSARFSDTIWGWTCLCAGEDSDPEHLAAAGGFGKQ